MFVWFGALKVIGASPVSDLVAGTLPWFDRAWLVPAIGLFEVVIGVGMVVGRGIFLLCGLLVAHLAGTFLALFMQSGVTFQHGNPLLLATAGEFIIKNLVLISAVLVLVARFDRVR